MAHGAIDKHDLDKMARWRGGLAGRQGRAFPAHALFLVGSENQAAHGIFRSYRASFLAHGAEFHHLVIFGQYSDLPPIVVPQVMRHW